MRHLLFAAVAACAAAASPAYAQRNPPEPQQPGYSSASSSAFQLKQLGAEWDRIGFSTPSKPAQSHVYGRVGYMTDGPGYSTMVALIRSAANDSRRGREQEALAKIARVRSLLGYSS